MGVCAGLIAAGFLAIYLTCKIKLEIKSVATSNLHTFFKLHEGLLLCLVDFLLLV